MASWYSKSWEFEDEYNGHIVFENDVRIFELDVRIFELYLHGTQNAGNLKTSTMVILFSKLMLEFSNLMFGFSKLT
jgi:hypothetical protein